MKCESANVEATKKEEKVDSVKVAAFSPSPVVALNSNIILVVNKCTRRRQ